MENDILVPVIAAASGAILLLLGLLRRRRAGSFAGLAPARPGALKNGERAAVTGAAVSPVVLSSPVTGAPCVFYMEHVERYSPGYGGRHGGNWEETALNLCGCFFIEDASGRAVVLPSYNSLDLARPETEAADGLIAVAGSVRRTEQLVPQGQAVTVIGTPLPLSALLKWLRSGVQAQLPTGTVELLAAMEKDPARAATPCFFGGDVEKVADREYGEYISAEAGGGFSLAAAGAGLLLAGLGWLLFVLKAASRDANL